MSNTKKKPVDINALRKQKATIEAQIEAFEKESNHNMMVRINEKRIKELKKQYQHRWVILKKDQWNNPADNWYFYIEDFVPFDDFKFEIIGTKISLAPGGFCDVFKTDKDTKFIMEYNRESHYEVTTREEINHKFEEVIANYVATYEKFKKVQV
jgi:hypothetical protein